MFFFRIKILDVNDSPPIIDMPNLVEITEYHEIRDVIASIKATDADDPRTLNGKLKITIAGGTGKGKLIF